MPFWDYVKNDAIDSAIKIGAEQVAPMVVSKLDDQTRQSLAKHSKTISKAGDFLRLGIPDTPGLKHVGEGLQNFFTELGRALETSQQPPTGSAEAEQAAKQMARQITTAVAIEQAVASLDDATRHRFQHWLDSTPERHDGFIRLAEGANKDEIRQLGGLQPAELDARIRRLPKENKTMTYLELREAIAADAPTTQKVTAFLGRLNTPADRTIEFWKAVEKTVEAKKIAALESFKQLFELTDTEITAFLNLGSGKSLLGKTKEAEARVSASIDKSKAKGVLDRWAAALEAKTGVKP
jgi:hypothetical protein